MINVSRRQFLQTVAAASALPLAGCANLNRLAAGGGRRWYKGVAHAHTLWSDGRTAPEYAVNWYRDAGYDFAALTDHNVLQQDERWFPIGPASPPDQTETETAWEMLPPERVQQLKELFGDKWVELRDGEQGQEMRLKTVPDLRRRFQKPRKFLYIAGEEVTCVKAVHLCAINTRATIGPAKGETARELLHNATERIDAHAREHGVSVLSVINHPNFADGVTAEDIIALGGYQLFEVYNGIDSLCFSDGDPSRQRCSTDRIWDIVLTVRLAMESLNTCPLLGVATDDTHLWHAPDNQSFGPGRGWVMVCAEALETNAILSAMRRGYFYASTGVTLNEIRRTHSNLTVEIQEQPGVTYTTQFIGSYKGVDLSSEPRRDTHGNEVGATRKYSEELGQVLFETADNPAVYPFSGQELYVRAKVTSSKPVPGASNQRAWVNPVLV